MGQHRGQRPVPPSRGCAWLVLPNGRPGLDTGGLGKDAKLVYKPHSVIGNHLSWPAGCPAALCALPGARRAASTPRLGLLRVEFDPFHPLPPRCRTGRRGGGSSSLCHLSSPHGGRVLPATLLCGVRTFLAPGLTARPRDCPTSLASISILPGFAAQCRLAPAGRALWSARRAADVHRPRAPQGNGLYPGSGSGECGPRVKPGLVTRENGAFPTGSQAGEDG